MSLISCVAVNRFTLTAREVQRHADGVSPLIQTHFQTFLLLCVKFIDFSGVL